MSLVSKAIVTVKGFASLTDADILLPSFPKSGSTWLRFVLCNWLNQVELHEPVVTFELVDKVMPEIGVSDLHRGWPYSSVPRFVKTHWRYNTLFGSKRVMLVLRDPRDVMISLHHHVSSRKRNQFQGSLQDLIRHSKYGLRSWFVHTSSWFAHDPAVILYSDMKANGSIELLKALDKLDVHYSADIIEKAFELSEFNKMKTIESQYGIPRDVFVEGKSFVRSGKSNQWEESFTDDDKTLYDNLVREFSDKLPTNILDRIS